MDDASAAALPVGVYRGACGAGAGGAAARRLEASRQRAAPEAMQRRAAEARSLAADAEARREAAMADALKEVDRVLASTKYTAEDLGAGDAVRVRGGKTPSRSLDADRGYGGV